jgi:hypothetical protein
VAAPPAAVAASEAAAASTPEEPASIHDWKRHHFLWPFWHIRPTSERQTANMVREEVMARIVTAPALGVEAADATAMVAEATFEVFKNSKAISVGQDLFFFSQTDEPSSLVTGRATKKVKTWEHDARREHATRVSQHRAT